MKKTIIGGRLIRSWTALDTRHKGRCLPNHCMIWTPLTGRYGGHFRAMEPRALRTIDGVTILRQIQAGNLLLSGSGKAIVGWRTRRRYLLLAKSNSEKLEEGIFSKGGRRVHTSVPIAQLCPPASSLCSKFRLLGARNQVSVNLAFGIASRTSR